ncbi:MAG: hypothetical protein A3K19_09720 [Lentisphaerae bacterium RIFOXYB12_FULL_65_16]|nr:MAG: hypothetical protein A3K53_07275 [Deltaproteobacteria bacterium RIFOXYB2_FULL_66_7]OGV73866.1 MAG: hypothetical protein A3K18_17240 [Lentisphaerae bacterium RIFOXYA12_64_32]OGV84073.1 MAG: hypothetical protein A3K19_09720 [Lentisphaerae bacterium RIFOXYB12_FULL_65_16]
MSQRIMIVDDHAEMRGVLREWLVARFPGESIVEAETAEQGLAMAVAADPDVVVMDFSLPGMNGIDATRRLRAMSPRVQVVMLTIWDSPSLRAAAAKAGAAAYVTKDRVDQDLAPVLARLLAGLGGVGRCE